MKSRVKCLTEYCGICFEKIWVQGKLNCCLHYFCFKCAKKWSERENSCPVCKKRFGWILEVNWRKRRRRREMVLDYVEDRSQAECFGRNDLVLMIEAALSMI